MSFEWRVLEAERFCEKVTDGTHDSPKQALEGKYLITSKHLKGFTLDFNNAYFINEEDFKNINKRSKVEQWDILFSMIGTIGEIYLEKRNEIEYAIKNVGLFKLNGDETKARWLFYYLKSPEANSYISANLRGSTQQYLPLGSLRSFPIKYTDDLKIIKNIISLLQSFDDKIELNSRMNKVLEQIAQAIFKQWFVDFEFPNEDGEPYKSSGGKMEWCEELGKEIPMGWYLDTIGNCSSLITRGIAPKYAEISSKRVINQKCIRDGALNLTLARPHVSNVSGEKLIRFGDILVNSTGTGTLGRVTQVYEHIKEYTVDTHVTIIRPKNVDNVEYIGCLLKNMQSLFENAATGSTGQTELGREMIKRMKIMIPDTQVIKKYSEIYRGFGGKIIRLQKEGLALSSLRDTLLPKLMTGEIDVSEVEL